jgi:hypothetical protein
MARLLSFSALTILATAAIVLLGCGSSRQLQSVTISPATADAKNFPGGQVPFTATGTFNKPPSPTQLTSQDVVWCYAGQSDIANPTAGTCAGNIAQYASVDQNGVAQCVPQFQGTVIILAGTGGPSGNPDGGTPLKIFGSAQLTCP